MACISAASLRVLLANPRTPNPETESVLVTVCEYMIKLMEIPFNYPRERAERAFIANKRDSGFGSQKGPQIAPKNGVKSWQKPGKSCQKLPKSWQKVAEKRGFFGQNLIKFVPIAPSSQGLKPMKKHGENGSSGSWILGLRRDGRHSLGARLTPWPSSPRQRRKAAARMTIMIAYGSVEINRRRATTRLVHGYRCTWSWSLAQRGQTHPWRNGKRSMTPEPGVRAIPSVR